MRSIRLQFATVCAGYVNNLLLHARCTLIIFYCMRSALLFFAVCAEYVNNLLPVCAEYAYNLLPPVQRMLTKHKISGNFCPTLRIRL
jgi:hypothetical protein